MDLSPKPAPTPKARARPFSLFVAMATVAILLTVIPASSAHSVQVLPGDVRVVVGLLEEPVTTDMKSGLDICFTTNTTDKAPVTIDTATLEVTLESPNGHSMTQALKTQFGRAGCYTFTDPIFFTQAGQYTVDLDGKLNGADFDVHGIKAGGAVAAMSAITFPDSHVAGNLQLGNDTRVNQQQIAQLQQTLADLQQNILQLQRDVAALKASQSPTTTAKGSPAPTMVLAGLAVVVVAFAARRRSE